MDRIKNSRYQEGKKLKILISDPIKEEGLEKLRERADIDIKTNLSKEELKKEIQKYDAIIVRSGTKLNEDILKQPGNLKVIGRAGVGVDNIDISTATKQGIIVINAPAASTISVAEHTLGLLLSATRNIPQSDRSIRNKKWEKSKFTGKEINGKKIGIFGLGRIGGEVAKRTQKLGMEVLAYDPYIPDERAEELGVEITNKEEVIKKSDFLTFHMPLTDETNKMISDKEFEKMKDTAIILNVARGGIIDEEALHKALKENKIKKAALDVFEEEPPFSSNLLDLDNIIMTPHLGAATYEAQQNVAISIAHQVIDSLEGKPVQNALNLPDLPPSEMEKLKPYIDLSEKLGSIIAQTMTSQVGNIEITFSGEISEENTDPLRNGVIKGFFDKILQEPVNFVKAPVIAKERNIKIKESKIREIEDFNSLIEVKVIDSEEQMTISGASGAIFGKGEKRLVKLGDYTFNTKIDERMLITKHKDYPGVIGKVGELLGRNEINIGSMQVGREKPKETAMMVLSIDQNLDNAILEEIKNIEEIIEAKFIEI
ncbi:phosphoglycerate dehydrogenase [archaeon SCG-AAA382B04]|nr:phosphoglycerate dehydrogenase [archaeon SCG-AAA382B04]